MPQKDSVASQDALALGVDAFELAAPDGPAQRAKDGERERDRQGNEHEEDVHGQGSGAGPQGLGSRASRAAFKTTSSELAAMPRPASHGGISPAMASGTEMTL